MRVTGTRTTTALVVLALLAAAATASAQEVAFLPLDVSHASISPAAQEKIEETLRLIARETLASAGFNILTAANTLKILADRNIDPLKATEASSAVEAGRELGAALVVAGSVATADGWHTAFIGLYDVPTGAALAYVKLEGTTARELEQALDAACRPAFALAARSLRAAPRASLRPAEKSGASVRSWTEERADYEWIALPPGGFTAGCLDDDPLCAEAEKPARPVELRGFQIGRQEVTVAQFAKCAASGSCAASARHFDADGGLCNWKRGRLQYPMNCVTWEQAGAFCAWLGARLPTGDEWEYAARSGEARLYPWGSAAPEPRHARFAQFTGTAAVATLPAGQTKWGLFDVAGNVAEWTSTQPDGVRVEVRGGAWNYPARQLRTSARRLVSASTWTTDLGFRCAL